jgi:hypothetical protein
MPFPCFTHLQAQPPYFTPTYLAGIFRIIIACPQQLWDCGIYELYKTGGLSVDDQARLDMAARASGNPRFSAAMPETFGVWLDFDPCWELRWMNFQFIGGRVVTMYQATYTLDHAYRYTIYFDPDTGTWANWEPAS